MGVFDHFPYTNFHELNLGWIMKRLLSMETELAKFVSLNTIKYADPIQWDITTQYETNTVVIDPNTGTAYLSSQPVPSGVNLANTDYWSVIFDLSTLIGNINQNLTVHNAGMSATATFDSVTGDWILWNGGLYEALSDIYIGYAYVPDANIKKKSVEELVKDYRDALYLYIGLLDDLVTSDKTSIVNAINSVLTDLSTIIGDINNLTTADTSSIVNAINEVVTNIGDLTTLTTTDKSSIVNAVNEVVANIGDLTTLTTTDKSSIVNAINEVDAQADANTTAITNEINIRKTLVNVLDYGADPTGIQDCTAAFNAAFAALPNTNELTPGGNAIYIPSGTYVLNNELNFTSKPVEIFGDGKNATRIIGWGSADPDSGYPTYFRVKRANIHGLRMEGDNNSTVCIRFVGGHDNNWTNNVYDCMFWWCLMGVQYQGACLNYSNNDCVNMSLGIHFYGGTINSIIADSYFGLYTQGIVTDASHEGMTIVNNYFVGGANSDAAIKFNGLSLSTIIDNNMFDQLYGTAGIKTIGAARDLKINNSWFGSNALAKDCAYGIEIAIGYYVKISNCLFVDMKYNDISITSGHDNFIEKCCDFYDDGDNTKHGAINDHCVIIHSGCARTRIVNCTLSPIDGTKYGIYADSGATGIVNMCKSTTNSVLTVVNPIS